MPDRSSHLHHLRFRHLQLLEALIEHGTVHKASRALHMSQPAASAMLRDFEEAVGVRFFERSPRGVLPTAAARAFATGARAIQHDLQRAAADATDTARGARQVLAVGAMPRVMLEFMPRLVARLRREWPEARLRLEEGAATQLLPQLEEGSLDCLISHVPHTVLASERAAALMHTRLYDDRVVMACGPNHPLARARQARLKDLAAADWTLPPEELETRRVFMNTFLQAGITPPQPVVEARSAHVNMALVENGDLLTAIPESAARARQKAGLLKIIPLRMDTSLPPVLFIWRRAQRESAPIARLKAIVERCAKEF